MDTIELDDNRDPIKFTEDVDPSQFNETMSPLEFEDEMDLVELDESTEDLEIRETSAKSNTIDIDIDEGDDLIFTSEPHIEKSSSSNEELFISATQPKQVNSKPENLYKSRQKTLLFALLPVALFFLWILTPASISLKKYDEIRKGAFTMRDFKITGIVHSAGPNRGMSMQLGDGSDLYFITITSGEEKAGVWYDPATIATPNRGEKVVIKGYFDNYINTTMGQSGVSKTGIARKIITMGSKK